MTPRIARYGDPKADPPQASASVLLDPIVPEALAQQIRAGRVIVIMSRASNSAGTEARRLAVQGIYTAAEELAANGVDVRHLLPAEEVLRRLVASQRGEPHLTPDGKRFRSYSYLHLDLLPFGLLLLVQYGTGTKTDDNDEQPAIRTAATTVDTYAPCLLQINEARSFARSGPGLAPLVFSLRAIERIHGTPAWVGRRNKGLQIHTLQLEKELTNEAFEAEGEARTTSERTAKAVQHRSAGGPVAGPFSIYVSQSLPPPLATCYLRPAEEGLRDRRAYLDTKGARPDTRKVLYGQPQIFKKGKRPSRARGTKGRRPVDQLALVRWFYQHYLTGPWTTLATGEYLASHGFSSEGLRRTKGLSATYRVRRQVRLRARDARNICQAIWRHHTFHLTGQLVLKLPGTNKTVIYDVATPDGRPIATLAQVTRIASLLKVYPATSPGRHVSILTGLKARHNSRECALTPDTRGPEVTWHFQTVFGSGRRRKKRRSPGVPLPHWVLVAAIYRAAKEAHLMPVLESPDDPSERLEAAYQLAQEEHRRAKDAAHDQWEHTKKKSHTEKSLTLAIEAATTADRAVQRASTDERLAKAALTEHENRQRSDAVALDQFIAFAAAIRDPFDPTLREQALLSIHQFEATSTRTRAVSDLRHRVLTFYFALRLVDHEGRLWDLPVRGRYEAGSALVIGPRVYAAIAAMHRGVPLREFFGAEYKTWLPHVRAALTGEAYSASVLVNVHDPYLLRLGMTICHPLGPEPDWETAGWPVAPEDFPLLVREPLSRQQRTRYAKLIGESPIFVHRLAELYQQPTTATGRWLPCSAPRLAAAIDAASKGQLAAEDLPTGLTSRYGTSIFEIDGDQVRLTACASCGSRERMLLQLQEPQGLVCENCRLDEDGTLWPADPYDRYRMRTRAEGTRQARPALPFARAS